VGLTVVLAASTGSIRSQSASALVIEEVAADSPAAQSGFAVGDRVLMFDSGVPASPAAFEAAEEHTFNSQTLVQIQRGDATQTLSVPSGKLGLRVRPVFSGETSALYDAGRAAERSQRSDVAVARWTAAAEAARMAGESVAAAWLLGRVGDLHEGARRWKDAVAAHDSAWQIVKETGDPAAQSRVLMALGRSSQSAGDLPAALQWFERAVETNAADGHEMWLASALNSRGTVANIRGNLALAQESYSRALSIRERWAPDSLEVAATLNGLGNVAFNRGELTGAGDVYLRALSIHDRLAPESLAAAAVLTNLGGVALEIGDLVAAEQYQRRSLAMRERFAPESMEVAASLNNLGMVLWQRGDLEEARDVHRRAIGIKERLAPDSLSMATSFTNIGNVAFDLGDFDAAYDYQIRALKIRERLAPDSVDFATSVNNVANVLRLRGDAQGSDDYHRRALAIRERLAPDSLSVSMSLRNLGDNARLRGDLTAAREWFTRALAIKQRLAPDSLDVAGTLTSLGTVAVSSGDLSAAAEYHSRALAIRTRLAPQSLGTAVSLNALGTIALRDRRFADALSMLRRAVAIVEEQRWTVRSAEERALLMAQHTGAFIGLIRAHVALGDTHAAFAAAERLRARSLLDSLAEVGTGVRQDVDPALLARQRTLQNEINRAASAQQRLLARTHTAEQAAAAAEALNASLAKYREMQADTRKAHPRYAALIEPQPITLAEVQRDLLDEDTVLVAYVLSDEDHSLLFAVTATSSRVVELPRRSEIEPAARRVYELMTARQPMRGEAPAARQARIAAADAAYPSAAITLSRMLLGPIAETLAGKRIVIVADGTLQYIPFAALPDPVSTAQPLIVNHEVVNLPSAGVLALLREQSQQRTRADRLVAVVADPVFDRDDPRLKRTGLTRADTPAPSLPAPVAQAVRATGVADDRGAIVRLPFTRDEARAILSLAPAGQATEAMDFKASRTTMTGADLSRYRVVHLATNGVLDTDRPEISGLVLSMIDERGQPQDGFFRLHDIYDLEWAAELVVLSACQTGLGKDIRGEGLVGLTRGFMYAGSERVIASLWNINDSVTAQLMRRFYRGLFTTKLSPAAALRAAQVEMWKQQPWQAPYYWAAFVLHGEWR